MKSINKVILIGNLTRDPELRDVKDGLKVCNFSLAVNDSYKNAAGEEVNNVTYIDCEAWSGLADIISKYLKKGSKTYIEGKLKSDTWVDADSGKNRTKYKIRVQDMMMLDSKQGSGDSSFTQSSSSQNKEDDADPIPDADDELPF